MHSVSLPRRSGGILPGKIKIRYFEIESGGTFCKINIVTFSFHDCNCTNNTEYRTSKILGGNSKSRGPVPLPSD